LKKKSKRTEERDQESTKSFQAKKIEETHTSFETPSCQAAKLNAKPFQDLINYDISQLPKQIQSPKEDMLVKRLKYLQKTKDAKLVYHSEPKELVGFSDASYTPNSEDRKSISGYLFQMNEAAISWKSKKQPIVSLSSMEAEYIAITAAIKEAKWLAKLEEELMLKSKRMMIFEDNQSTIKTAKNEIHTDRSKHRCTIPLRERANSNWSHRDPQLPYWRDDS
jgi:hypothetical protein